jgi:hypothetical protein
MVLGMWVERLRGEEVGTGREGVVAVLGKAYHHIVL